MGIPRFRKPPNSDSTGFNGIQWDSIRNYVESLEPSWAGPQVFVGPWRHGFQRGWFSKSHLLGGNTILMGLFWKFRGTPPKMDQHMCFPILWWLQIRLDPISAATLRFFWLFHMPLLLGPGDIRHPRWARRKRRRKRRRLKRKTKKRKMKRTSANHHWQTFYIEPSGIYSGSLHPGHLVVIARGGILQYWIVTRGPWVDSAITFGPALIGSRSNVLSSVPTFVSFFVQQFGCLNLHSCFRFMSFHHHFEFVESI